MEANGPRCREKLFGISALLPFPRAWHRRNIGQVEIPVLRSDAPNPCVVGCRDAGVHDLVEDLHGLTAFSGNEDREVSVETAGQDRQRLHGSERLINGSRGDPPRDVRERAFIRLACL